MDANPRRKLAGELEDIVSLRLAMVLAPVLQILDAWGESQLADFLKDFGTDLTGDFEWILSHYEVEKAEDHP